MGNPRRPRLAVLGGEWLDECKEAPRMTPNQGGSWVRERAGSEGPVPWIVEAMVAGHRVRITWRMPDAPPQIAIGYALTFEPSRDPRVVVLEGRKSAPRAQRATIRLSWIERIDIVDERDAR